VEKFAVLLFKSVAMGYDKNLNMVVYPPSRVWVEKKIQLRIFSLIPRKMDMDCSE
jgi:hypothetical protein